MPISNVGKPIGTIIGPDGDVFVFFHDYVTTLNNMTVRMRNATGDVKYTMESGTLPEAGERVLMFKRIYARDTTTNPLKFVPLVVNDNADLNGDKIQPFYEVINPTIKTMDGADTAIMTFWTNFIADGESYDPINIRKIKQDQIDDLEEQDTNYRVLCACLIHFKKFHITGGEVGQNKGGATETETSYIETLPICTKPFIVSKEDSYHPAFDFASGGGTGSGGGFRRHDHATNSIYDGGFAFGVFHPGTGVPKKPWEAN